MRTSRSVHIIGCHAEGEVGDVIIGGVTPPPGDTIWEQRAWIAADDSLRRFVLNEPRGGVFRHINLLVLPKDPRADAAFIIMEPEDTPPMSGSNSICVATVLLDAGIIPMVEPETVITMEAPGGLVEARVACRNGKAERVTITNLPSFASRLDASLEVPGIGTVSVDTAYGGDSFVLTDAVKLGFQLAPDEARDIASMGQKIKAAADEQLAFCHPEQPDWQHYSFCQFTGPLSRQGSTLTGKNTVVIKPGKLDRSPTGTGCSARMAVLAAKGEMDIGDQYVARSIIDSEFQCAIATQTTVAGTPAIIPTISGRAWITGRREDMVDPDDPYPLGYRLSDTWPQL